MIDVYPIIIAGGSGTRFWPLSRRALPKQFLALASNSPLIAETVRRLTSFSSLQRTWVVCGKAHEKLVRRTVSRIPRGNVLVEPMARNTAPAIALAALHVSAIDPAGVLVVLPADHHVKDAPKFRKCLVAASDLARQGYCVTIGIRPTRPETGYGYIRVGARLAKGANRVKAFTEKPDLATARRYLRSGRYLWNSGVFAFRVDVFWNLLSRHLPQVANPLLGLSSRLGQPSFRQQLARAFRAFPSISIDYGVMEKAENLAVVAGEFGWSDVGSFAAMSEVRPSDRQGNVIVGSPALLLGCRDCVVVSKGRLLAVQGVSNALVVDSGDAVLVAPKDKSQEVRQICEALSTRGLKRYL